MNRTSPFLLVLHKLRMLALHLMIVLVWGMIFTACQHDQPLVQDPWSITKVDSTQFVREHHFWKGFNFLVTDSMALSSALPGEVGSIFVRDSTWVIDDDPLVVVNLASVPNDSIDSMWVMVAKDPQTLGWVRRSELHQCAVPDNTISRCIHAFSDVRLLVLLCSLSAALLLFFIQRLRHARIQIVHFNDIQSFYPTLLCIVVSGSAVLYGALQQFAPEVWEEFYYHPTLNLFAREPLSLRIFIISLWTMLIVGIAVVDDLRKQPGVVDGVAYLAALSGVCMVLYLFFTLSVHLYIGYPLLLGYWVFALRRHFFHNSTRFRCGHCGNALHHVGKCPYCGAVNE